MSDNPFHDAVQPTPQTTLTHEVPNHPPFFQAAIEQSVAKRKARNMTRQDMFNNGLLTVEDMDDEELRLGQMRGPDGKIRRSATKTEMVPRDLYDEMVAEHQRRTNEKIRQELDTALATLVEIMSDPTVEPKDRADAAKYLFERQMGKTPERVQVAVSKAPWEELLGDVAHITRAQHNALKQGAIDAEVVEIPEDSTQEGQSKASGVPAEPWEAVDVPIPSDVDNRGTSDVRDGSGPGRELFAEPVADDFFADATPFAPPINTPTHDNPASSNPVEEMTRSEQLRRAQQEQERIALARKARKDAVQSAKKRRIAQRAMGVDVLIRNNVGAELGPVQDRFTQAMGDEPNTDA